VDNTKPTRSTLMIRHGTVREFALAVDRCRDQFGLTVEESTKAIESYRKQWDAAENDLEPPMLQRLQAMVKSVENINVRAQGSMSEANILTLQRAVEMLLNLEIGRQADGR
jgi:hypothetical protein